ncbi:DUF6095 family protein [Costertonia aggregata]|uniref:Uncharacterized protein n=1 Tax=Costertonia aggregata TaxID=343403 RepID=A0A7H9AKN7_9FLAO|nr:DUF6095 family protein [Costertonia aggregata]QLG43884.1 hypothetical protein HYG79_00460 [Costertonia aggregata]
MKTNKNLLFKGLKFLGYTTILMFTAPAIIYRGFQSEGHPLYWPVLILGFILAIGAVLCGFYGIKLLIDSLFGKKK